MELKDGIEVFRSYNTKFMDLLPYDIIRMHFWWRNGYKDALKLFEKNHFDVVHCHDLDTLSIGIRLKEKIGKTKKLSDLLEFIYSKDFEN